MLNNRQDFIAYREDSVKAYAAQTKKIIVCAGTGCVAGGSLHIHAKLNEIMQAKGLPVAVELMVEAHRFAILPFVIDIEQDGLILDHCQIREVDAGECAVALGTLFLTACACDNLTVKDDIHTVGTVAGSET